MNLIIILIDVIRFFLLSFFKRNWFSELIYRNGIIYNFKTEAWRRNILKTSKISQEHSVLAHEYTTYHRELGGGTLFVLEND